MAEEVLRIIVSGRVQGVGFRNYAESVSRRMGIAGWVRNLSTGEVEIMARVDPGRKAAWIAAIRKGPPLSRVQDLDVEKVAEPADCPAQGFTTRD